MYKVRVNIEPRATGNVLILTEIIAETLGADKIAAWLSKEVKRHPRWYFKYMVEQ